MTIMVQVVATAHVQQVWPSVAEYFEQAIAADGGDDYTLDQMRLMMATGSWLLLVGSDAEGIAVGAAAISFINYPNHRVAFVTAIGGRLGVDNNAVQQLAALCKQYGATKIQGYGRDSIVRLWERVGFTKRATLVEYSL
jgi:hypothetical protein